MAIIFKDETGEWGINQGMSTEYLCIRHLGCCQDSELLFDEGRCACSKGVCNICNAATPEYLYGFLDLIRWSLLK